MNKLGYIILNSLTQFVETPAQIPLAAHSPVSQYRSSQLTECLHMSQCMGKWQHGFAGIFCHVGTQFTAVFPTCKLFGLRTILRNRTLPQLREDIYEKYCFTPSIFLCEPTGNPSQYYQFCLENNFQYQTVQEISKGISSTFSLYLILIEAWKNTTQHFINPFQLCSILLFIGPIEEWRK